MPAQRVKREKEAEGSDPARVLERCLENVERVLAGARHALLAETARLRRRAGADPELLADLAALDRLIQSLLR